MQAAGRSTLRGITINIKMANDFSECSFAYLARKTYIFFRFLAEGEIIFVTSVLVMILYFYMSEAVPDVLIANMAYGNVDLDDELYVKVRGRTSFTA